MKDFIIDFIIACTVLMCVFTYNKEHNIENPIVEEIQQLDSSFLYTSEINDSLFLLVCDYYGVKDSKIVLAQAHLESTSFTSNVFKTKNNCLGLYNSKKGTYYKFDSWQDCILGYINKIEYKKKDNEDHYVFLQRIGYAEDPEYINKVKRIYNAL